MNGQILQEIFGIFVVVVVQVCALPKHTVHCWHKTEPSQIPSCRLYSAFLPETDSGSFFFFFSGLLREGKKKKKTKNKKTKNKKNLTLMTQKTKPSFRAEGLGL
jgi:hypothetical protein